MKMNNYGLGSVNGEQITGIIIRGTEQDEEIFRNIKSYQEAYDKIKELKKFDKENGIEDEYKIILQTEWCEYGTYTLRKYRSGWTLK